MVVVKWGSFPLTTGLRTPLVHFPARNAQRKGTVFCQVRLSVWDRLPIAGALTLGQSRFSCGLGRASRRGVRRQLFPRIDKNYLPGPTKIPFGLLGAARRPPPGGGRSPPAARFLFLRSIYIRGGGKVGNLLLVFHFSIRPRRRSCGNVGIAPPFGEISKGLVERGGSLLLAFHAFHSPGISTAHTPSGFAPWHHAGSPPSSSAWFSACCFCLACSTR